MVMGSKSEFVVAAVLAVFMLAPAALWAAPCDDVIVRLWQRDNEFWYDYGEAVEIESGEEGHIYLHVRSRSPNPYGTSAEIGYPREVGGGRRIGPRSDESAREVARHLDLKPQSADDRRDGRLRLQAKAPGRTSLGYRIEAVAGRGDLGDLPPPCRSGEVTIHVKGDGRGSGGPRPGPVDLSTPQGAAHGVVRILFRGLLQRDHLEPYPDSYVSWVYEGDRDGAMRLGGEMVASREFREKGARSNREQLLHDIYHDLYGQQKPSPSAYEEDRQDLDACLAGGESACRRLGANLVGSPLFYEQHRGLIDTLRRR